MRMSKPGIYYHLHHAARLGNIETLDASACDAVVKYAEHVEDEADQQRFQKICWMLATFLALVVCLVLAVPKL